MVLAQCTAGSPYTDVRVPLQRWDSWGPKLCGITVNGCMTLKESVASLSLNILPWDIKAYLPAGLKG